MALKNLFDMVKADRYTQDGREAIIKAQEAETEDVKYQNGDISQKTGLMKTPNGWVEPPKGKQPGAKKEGYKPSRRVDPKKQPQVSNPNVLGMTANGAKKRFEALGGEFLENKDGVDIFKTRDGDLVEVHYGDNKKVLRTQTTPADSVNLTTVRQGPKTKTLNETPAQHVQKNLDAYKGYQAYDMESLVLKPSGYERQTSARVPGGGQSITYTKNGAEDITLFFDKHGELENADVAGSKPATESKPDAADQRDQIGEEIKGNLETAKYYFDKAQSFSLTDPSFKTYMAKAKEYNDKAKAQADDNGFDWEEMHNRGITRAVDEFARQNKSKATDAYSWIKREAGDSAPRQLTGDTRIRVRKA
ncbi:MAG: hypothetical protein IIZ93_00320 [Acidaminococcaceae bacterium]|nr:hypothetical protein [Acidaminococcaceae bacterium]